MRILDAHSMKEVDREATEDFGIPGPVLMENAAIGLADAITDNYPGIASAAILCGPGNNGGDGLALARHLTIRGYHVEVSLLTTDGGLSDDAQIQLNICRNQGVAVREFGPDDSLHPAIESARSLDIVVDALFGIGLTRPLSGHFAEAVGAVNSIAAPKVAVDLPSGLDGSRAEIPGLHFAADLTVTFGAPKIAHVFPPASESVGEVVVADLGVPLELIERAPGNLHLLVGDELGAHLMPRPLASHKGDYGHVVVMAGSEGKAGAAILAARSAVRAGAGLVTAAVPRLIVQTVDLGSIESMTLALPVTDRGGLGRESIARILDFVADKNVLALGPGLGTDPSTVEVVRSVVLETELPLVVDADGLNAFAGDLDSLAARRGDAILTPHPGELARLLRLTTQEVQADRVGAAGSAAERSRSVVILKGYRSLVATPGGQVFVNSTGNPGMASGGTGDVLTGLVAGLLGQGHPPSVAAQLGVYLHGLAGDLAAEEVGQIGLAAGDVLRDLPRAFRQLGQ